LLAEGVIRGVAEKVVNAFLPYASLHSVDDGSHAPVKFARHIDHKRIFIDHRQCRGMTVHNMLQIDQRLRKRTTRPKARSRYSALECSGD
jgi:hypothetical protein